MTTKRKYKSKIFQAVHSIVEGMHRAGTIDESVIREFDETCLVMPKLRRSRDKKLPERSRKPSD